MKIWLRILLLVAFVGSAGFTNNLFASAGTVKLQWQASPDKNVAGYALYYGVSGFAATNRLDVGQMTAAAVADLNGSASYYFFVVAYDASQQESDPSNVLVYSPPTMSSLQLTQAGDGTVNLSFYVAPNAACSVEYTDTLNPPSWQLLTTAIGDSNGLVSISDPIVPGGTRFYRAVTQ